MYMGEVWMLLTIWYSENNVDLCAFKRWKLLLFQLPNRATTVTLARPMKARALATMLLHLSSSPSPTETFPRSR